MNTTKKPRFITLKSIQDVFLKKEKELRIPFVTLTKKEKDILSKTVKLSEEVGELSNEILGSLSLQRKSKLKKFHKKDINEEFADVILTVTTLANSLDVNLDVAVKEKLNKVISTYSKDK